MKLKLTRSILVRLVLFVAATGTAASWVIGNDAEHGAPGHEKAGARNAAAKAAPAAQIATFDLGALARPLGGEIRDDLFRIPAPRAPPPPPKVPPPRVVEAPPPKPTAPPLPFTYMGRLVDKGTTMVFVAHNGQSLTLKQGDTAADVYRVEQITPTEIVFVYEPLAERQVLAMGAAN